MYILIIIFYLLSFIFYLYVLFNNTPVGQGKLGRGLGRGRNLKGPDDLTANKSEDVTANKPEEVTANKPDEVSANKQEDRARVVGRRGFRMRTRWLLPLDR